MKHLTRITALAFLTSCLLILSGCSQKSTTESSKSSNEPASQKPKTNRPAPDFTVTATDLYKEHQADGRRATHKYARKQVAVTGRVMTVIVSTTPMSVSLAAGGSGASMDFLAGRFDEGEKQSIVALKPDQNVTMQCLVGDMILSFLQLEHCAIVNVE